MKQSEPDRIPPCLQRHRGECRNTDKLPNPQAGAVGEHEQRNGQQDEEDVERPVQGERRPHPFAALRRLALEDAEVVAARRRERRCEEERRAAGGEDASGHNGLATETVDDEIRGGDRQSDEHPAVKVGPERDERDEEPDAPARSCGPRRGGGAARAQNSTSEKSCARTRMKDGTALRRRPAGARARRPRRMRRRARMPEAEQRKRRGRSHELGQEQAPIPADHLQAVEDELAEDRHVDPVDGR